MTDTITLAESTNIPLGEIWCDEEFNSRGHITPASVVSIAEDIYKNGLFQNPVVQEISSGPLGTRYKMVMGHRRYEGFRLNQRLYPSEERWNSIPCKVVKPLLAHEARIMNLKENMEREKLNMMHEARSIAWFKKEGWSALRVAKDLGVSKKWVEVRYGLLALPEEIQRRAEADMLTFYQVEECIRKSTREEQIQYVRNVVDHLMQGRKLTAEDPREKKKRQAANALMSKGTLRTMVQLAAVQAAIQDSFKDLRHPAAMALAFAMGVIGYEEFVKLHINGWVIVENDRRADQNLDPIRFIHPESMQ
jgi:ParB/RepB/Spo0J family partition protein